MNTEDPVAPAENSTSTTSTPPLKDSPNSTNLYSGLPPETLRAIEDAIAKKFIPQSTDKFDDDPCKTQAQKDRDQIITQLLDAYYISYVEKMKIKKYCQLGIFGLCSTFILGSMVGLLFLTSQLAFHPKDFSDLNAVVGFVTAFVSFIALVFGLATIITKYVFPENDEEYIATIVKAIQDNDYKMLVESHRLIHGQSSGNNPSE